MDKKSILKENEISAKQTINLLKNNKKNISFLDIRERKEYVHGFACLLYTSPSPRDRG